MIEIRLDPAKYLVRDNTCDIFSSLGFEGVKVCRLVSKLWNKLADHDQVWVATVPGIKDIIKLDANFEELTEGNYFKKRIVTSLQDLKERFAEFNSEVSVKGSFDCFFPFNPGCHFNAKVQYGYCDWLGRTPELKKQWIYVKELPNDERGNEAHHRPSNGFPPTPTPIVIGKIRDQWNLYPSFDCEIKSILPIDISQGSRAYFNETMAKELTEKRATNPRNTGLAVGGGLSLVGIGVGLFLDWLHPE